MISKIIDNIETQLSEWAKPVGVFLDDHPDIYKAYVVAMHVFRAVSMFALMEISPFPALLTMGGMLGASYLYFSGIENRACVFKFTMLSAFGGAALWATKAAAITLLAEPAFTVLSIAGMALGTASLVLYAATVYYVSLRDVDSYLEKKKGESPISQETNDCCCK